MKIIFSKKKLKKFVHNEKNLGFVPTMGAIHLGHISLIKKSISQCDKTIVSIFINKPQFNKKSDFKRYPRVLNTDISVLKKTKIDYLYLPSEKQIYPHGQNKILKISPLENKLCGKSRPGHFKAVVDVIDNFVKIVKPDKIYFGEKDMQQLIIINEFIKKNYINIKIVPCRTIREKNGLAYSSRNFLLTQKEKNTASKIYRILKYNKKNLLNNFLTKKKIKSKILDLGVEKIDYIEIIDINKLITPYKKKRRYKIFIAYYLGSTRLIDNI